MPAELAVALLGFVAQLAEFLGIVEDVGEALPFPSVRRPGSISRLAVIVQPMREPLLVSGLRLAPGLCHLRLPCDRAVIVEPVAQLVDRQAGARLSGGDRVEICAVPLVVGEDGLAGVREQLGRLAPPGPGVETGDGNAALAGVKFERLVRLDMPFRRRQIALGNLARGDVVVMVVE